MLATPDRPVFVMHAANKLTQSISKECIEYPKVGDGTCEIELWSYDPQFFATGNSVDVLSLYLSLKDEDDERVQQALSDMMEKMEW